MPRHADPPHAEGGQSPADGRQEGQGENEAMSLELVRLVDRLQQENLMLAGQVGFLQAKLQTAEETIRLLQAPKDEPIPEPAAQNDAVPAEPAPAQQPWWRRAWTWLNGPQAPA